jgi:hypothetical protein
MPLEGTWFNELGSTMTINPVTPNGFSGTYQTAVSTTGCAQGVFTLIGISDTDNDGTSVAFAVAWTNGSSQCHSVTAWSGQLQIINNEEQIIATWLLTSETNPGQDWASTLVGSDIFTRNPLSKKQRAVKSKQKPPSHP